MAKKQKLDFSVISSKPKLDFSNIGSVTQEEQEQPVKKKVQEDTESVSEDGSLESQEVTKEVEPTGGFDLSPVGLGEDGEITIEQDFSPIDEEAQDVFQTKKKNKESQEQAVSYVGANLTDDQLLSKSTQDLADELDTDIYSSDLNFALKGRKNDIINARTKEYSEEVKKSQIDSLLSEGLPQAEADSIYASTKKDDLLKSGIKVLGLDEEEVLKYSDSITEYYTLRNKGSERTDEENIKLVGLGEEIKNLREDMNAKEFINPETNNIDQEKAEESINLVLKYEKELKTDQQKFSERYSSERDKLKYLEKELLSMFDEGSGKDGITRSSVIEDIPSVLKGGGVLDNIYMRDEAEEAVNKYKSLYEEYEDTKSNFSALSRALLLNEDPASVSRGLGESDIPYLGAVMNVIGNVITAGGESLIEESTGFNVQTDSDFASKIVQISNEEGVKVTPEQAERAIPRLDEKVGAAMGTSLPMMAEIMVNTVIGNKVKGVLGIPKLFSKIKYLKDSPKITKLLDNTLEATQQALVFEFTSGGSAAMGVGEFLGEKGFEKAISKLGGKYGKVFKLLGKTLSAGAGATAGEYAGDFAEQSFKSGFLSEKSFKETFGRDYDEGLDKFLVTAIMSTVMGAGSQVGSFLSDSQAYYDSIGDTQRSGEIQQLIDANKANDLVARVKSGEATIEELESVLGSGKDKPKKLDDMSKEELDAYAKENDIGLEEEIKTEEKVKSLDEKGIVDKIDNKESINEAESEVYTNKIYDLIDSEEVVEGSETESKLYDLIEKVENYERKTETVKKETTETRLLTRFKQNAGKINRKAFRDQVAGSKSTFRGKDGTIEVSGGKVVFKTKDGSKTIGNTADILTQDFTTDNILIDSDGNVTGVRITTPDGEVTINNPEVGLDMGIQLQEKKLGRHPMSDVEAVYSEVLKEESIEVPVSEENISEFEETKKVKTEIKEEVKPVDNKPEVKPEDTTFSKEEQSVIDTLEDSKEINRSLEDQVIIDSFKKKGISESQAKNLVKKYKTSKKSIKKEIREQTGQTDTSPKVVTTQSKILKDKYKNLTTGEKLGTKRIKGIQKDFSDFIKDNAKYINSVSPKITAALLKKVSSISSKKSLDQALDYVDKIVTKEDFRNQEKSRLSKADKIRKELSDKSLRNKGSKPASGKIDVESIDMLKKAEKYLDTSKSEASAKMDDILSKYSPEEEISISDIEELNALNYADLDNLSLQELTQLEESTKEFKKEGRDFLKLKRQVRKEYRDSVTEKVEMAVAPESKIKGTTSRVLSERKSTVLGKIKHHISNPFESAKHFMNYNEDWAGLVNSLNALGKKDTGSAESARDFLKKDLIDPINKASSDKVKGIVSFIDKMRDAKKKIFGKDYKKKIVENTKYKAIKDQKGKVLLTSKGDPVLMSNNEAMYIYNLTKDPTLEETLDKQEDESPNDKTVVKAALRVIDTNPELKEYADWVHEVFYPEYYNRVNKEYRKQYDYNLPFNPNFSPIFRDGFKEEMNINNLSASNNIASTLNGSLKERVSNTTPLKLLENDIDMVMNRYANQMEQFVSSTDVVKNLNAVFSNPKIKQAINQQKGDYFNEYIKQLIQDFAAGRVAREDIALTALSKLRINVTTANLGANPSLLLKQLTSAPAYAVQTDTRAYLKQIPMTFTKEGLKDVKKILDSPFIKNRRSVGFDRDMALMMKRDINEILSGFKSIPSRSMALTKWGDVGAILLGGTPYFRVQRNKYEKTMSKEKAEEKAMHDFENATKSVQQSSNIEDMSTAQRGGELAKIFTMYKTSPAQYFRQTSSAYRNIQNGRGTLQDYKKIVMFQFILPALFTAAGNGFTWEEEDLSDYLSSVASGNIQGLIYIGDVIQHISDVAQGKPFKYESTPIIGGIVKALEVVFKAMAETGLNTEIEDFLLKGLVPLVEAKTGLPLKNAKKLTLDMLEKIGKGEYKTPRELLKLLGWSEYNIDRLDSKKKSKSKKQRKTR